MQTMLHGQDKREQDWDYSDSDSDVCLSESEEHV